MSYHLSKINRLIAADIFKEIKDGNGFAVLHTDEPDRIIYIIRSAMHTEYKEWKGLITLRKKENKVVVKPSVPSITKITDPIIPTSSLKSFNSIASLIIEEPIKLMSFPDATLTESESNALKKLCDSNFFELSFNPLTIRKV